jgi:hypothetical protein
MVIGLGWAVVLLWREVRGPVRQPGMGLGDDPLWSSGDLDL